MLKETPYSFVFTKSLLKQMNTRCFFSERGTSYFKFKNCTIIAKEKGNVFTHVIVYKLQTDFMCLTIETGLEINTIAITWKNANKTLL
jgi:hypothetical protein